MTAAHRLEHLDARTAVAIGTVLKFELPGRTTALGS